MKKRLKLLITFLLILVTFAGCTPAATQPETKSVRVILDYLPNTNHIGLYVAASLGYYTEEGLDVSIIEPSEGATATLIATGKGEFGISYQEDVTYARTAQDPLPVRAIAAILQHNTSGFASAREKNITSPLDFAGKTYAGWGSPAEEAIIRAVMERAGADPSDISFIQSSGADSITALQNQIDLTWIYYGWTGIEYELADFDFNYLPVIDLYPALDFYTPVIIAAESYLKDNPELTRAFLKATARGYLYCIEQPGEAARLFVEAQPDYSREMIEESVLYLKDYFVAKAPRWGEMTTARWDDYTGFMIDSGLIDRDMPASEAFTNEYLPADN